MKSIIMGPALVKRVKAAGVARLPFFAFPCPERSPKIIRAFTAQRVYNEPAIKIREEEYVWIFSVNC